ncbi:MAG: diguanylate cyclase [Pseudomonadales bacterium]
MAGDEAGILRALCDCCAQLLALGPDSGLREALAAFLDRARDAQQPAAQLLADYVELQRHVLESCAMPLQRDEVTGSAPGVPAELAGLPVYTTVADAIEGALARLLHGEAVRSVAPGALDQQFQKIEQGINWYEFAALLGEIADWFHTARGAGFDRSTGLLAGAALEHHLQVELERLQRFDHTFCLAVIEITQHAQLLERYGEAAVEKALHLIARILRGALRGVDFIGRGTDASLLLLLPETAVDDARGLLSDIDSLVRRSPFHFARQRIKISLVAGLAEASASDTVQTLLKKADEDMP